jgi:hypothetical protein
MIIDEDPILPSLSPLPTSYVADPVFATTVEIERDLVPAAGPTSGPNRYTLHVPTEVTRLSLGALSGKWNTDKGITGYTDGHVHFETKELSKTVVSLGGPATTSSIKGYGDAAPVSTHGYSMVTAENAWHDAQKQHYLISRQDDITLRTKGAAKRAVIQAEHGFVDINGGTAVNIAALGVTIGAQEGIHFEDVKYAGHYAGHAPHSMAAKSRKNAMNWVAAATAAHDLGLKAKKTRDKYKAGELEPTVDTFADGAKWLADLAKFGLTVAKLYKYYFSESSKEGCIKIDAEKDFGGSAGGEVAFFGITGASLGSTIWTSVSGGVVASLKGTLFAGVGSLYTSLKGYKSIEMGSDWGDTVVNAAKEVEVAADTILAGGERFAQVSSKKEVYLGGGTKAFVGTPAGDGWGLLMDAAGVKIGKATGADTMSSATIADDRSIHIHKDGFKLTSGSTAMEHTRKGTTTKAADIKLHAKDADVCVNGKKVLIDG